MIGIEITLMYDKTNGQFVLYFTNQFNSHIRPLSFKGTFNDFCYNTTLLINKRSNVILASSIFYDYCDKDDDNAKV